MSIKTILVNITGTNPNTRAQKFVCKRFNGLGQEIDPTGNVLSDAPALQNLGSGTSTPPQFPQADVDAAAKAGDFAKVQSISLAYASQVDAWQKSQSGGTDEIRVAKSVLEYCYTTQGFIREDGDGFVLKMENLDVKRDELKEGGLFFTVAGTAVFGAVAQ